jgi:serine/threonine-protein kinase
MAQAEPKVNLDTVVGRLVVEQGLATDEEVEQVRKALKRASEGSDPKQRSLVSALISQGVVTKRQVERLKPQIEAQQEAQKSDRQIPGFQIIKKLGAGAMATVYLARQLSLDREVAIKILPQKFMSNPQFVERFYAEGRAAAKLNHPNIVGALDVGKAGDYHYFVMEYVEGRTVYDDIVEHKQYTEADSLAIVIQVARALDHAHKAGFIHRDVKPKNIMITKDGVVKLADMGLARAVSDREAAEAEQGKAYGTPYYISPEQIRGEIDVDFRADIYSLGATFYHMVTGKVPFDGANPSAVMHKHLKSELEPPDHINQSLSAGMGEVIEVCMTKDRNKRYNTTSDLLADLEALAKGEAPLQARKKFDLSTLTALEQGTEIESDDEVPLIGAEGEAPPLFEQPIFWAAVAGWLVAVILLVLVFVT